jgi:hypothetical protein
VIQLLFVWFSAVGEEDISTVYANCIAGSREQRQASSIGAFADQFDREYDMYDESARW